MDFLKGSNMHEEFVPRWEQRIVGPFVRATMFKRRRGKDWTVPDHLPHEVFTLHGNNGARLPARWFPASTNHTGKAAGTVVLCHPDKRYAQHWWIVSGWVDQFLEAGFNVLTFDFTQYGGSKGGSTYLYQDVICATHEARRRAPEGTLHVFGVSLGAFAAAVASPWLEADTLILESPYPDFGSWYEDTDGQMGRTGRLAMGSFARIFPATDAMIRADRRIPDAKPAKILITASRADDVTGETLSRRVAEAAPSAKTTYNVLADAAHLTFHESPEYRAGILAVLGAPAPVAAR